MKLTVIQRKLLIIVWFYGVFKKWFYTHFLSLSLSLYIYIYTHKKKRRVCVCIYICISKEAFRETVIDVLGYPHNQNVFNMSLSTISLSRSPWRHLVATQNWWMFFFCFFLLLCQRWYVHMLEPKEESHLWVRSNWLTSTRANDRSKSCSICSLCKGFVWKLNNIWLSSPKLD